MLFLLPESPLYIALLHEHGVPAIVTSHRRELIALYFIGNFWLERDRSQCSHGDLYEVLSPFLIPYRILSCVPIAKDGTNLFVKMTVYVCALMREIVRPVCHGTRFEILSSTSWDDLIEYFWEVRSSHDGKEFFFIFHGTMCERRFEDSIIMENGHILHPPEKRLVSGNEFLWGIFCDLHSVIIPIFERNPIFLHIILVHVRGRKKKSCSGFDKKKKKK